MARVIRVLVPNGVAYVKIGGKLEKTVKPWPNVIDEWTHWLHDASNNVVAHDTRVGSPQRMQWVAEPLWSRGHEVPGSTGGVVIAHGRIIYDLDEGHPGVYGPRVAGPDLAASSWRLRRAGPFPRRSA